MRLALVVLFCPLLLAACATVAAPTYPLGLIDRDAYAAVVQGTPGGHVSAVRHAFGLDSRVDGVWSMHGDLHQWSAIVTAEGSASFRLAFEWPDQMAPVSLRLQDFGSGQLLEVAPAERRANHWISAGLPPQGVLIQARFARRAGDFRISTAYVTLDGIPQRRGGLK